MERSFAALWRQVRAILNHAGVTPHICEQLWAENVPQLPPCAISQWQEPTWSALQKRGNLCKRSLLFGEVGIRLSKLYGLPEKIANKGNKCLFLGYESNHLYKVFDLKTNLSCWQEMLGCLVRLMQIFWTQSFKVDPRYRLREFW